MFISTRYKRSFMPNLLKKSLTISTLHPKQSSKQAKAVHAEVGHPSPVLFFCVFGIGNIKYEIVIIIATNETTLRMETFFLFSSSQFFPTTCGIRGDGKGWGQRGMIGPKFCRNWAKLLKKAYLSTYRWPVYYPIFDLFWGATGAGLL